MIQDKNEIRDISADRFETLLETQMATLNILEDFNAEKLRLEETQRAVLNILEDFDTEKCHLEMTQKATLNIMEDFNAEKLHMDETQRGVMNILEDFNVDRQSLHDTQKALLNILDDLNQSREALRKAHDVLEIRVKERTAELQQRTIELEASNKELEAFSYSVSHDLRAPLRTLDGFSLAILEDYGDKLDEQGKDYLQRIRAASQHMGQLIDDMLRLSRVTRAEMHMEPINLSQMTKAIADDLTKSQPERNVEFVIMPDIFVYGDVQLIRLVLENMMDNAMKFTAKRDQARIEMGVTWQDGKKAYYLRDNGVGFDMAYANKLFKPFQRLHPANEFPGTGIGLATVQRIINRHGGHVWAESGLDKGTTFYFTL